MKGYIAFFRTMPGGLIHVLNYANDNSADYFESEQEVRIFFKKKKRENPGLMDYADRLFMINIDSECLPYGKPIEVDID